MGRSPPGLCGDPRPGTLRPVTSRAHRLNDLAALVPPLGRLRHQRDDLAQQAQALARENAGLRSELAEETRALREDVERWRVTAEQLGAAEPAYQLYPPGHFYSPLPDLDEVRAKADRLFDRSGDLVGIGVRLDEQLALLDELAPVMAEWPYASGASDPDLRYRPDNGYFGWTDSQLWYGLLRTVEPRRVIEIGSGWSTALLLDTIGRHDLKTELTCVEPYPERLLSTMRPEDHDRVTLVQERAQDVSPETLAGLQAGDVLFIDSTHVAKIGSDVNHLVFEVFPRLPAGVHVHVHDIAYPFEYPQEWVEEGRAWNEAYVLRAFLTDNPRWQVQLWPSLLNLRHREAMEQALAPGTPVDGGSLWLLTT